MNPKLLVDLGNSTIVMAMSMPSETFIRRTVQHNRDIDRKTLDRTVTELISEASISPSACALCSVVPQMTDRLIDWVSARFGLSVFLLAPGTRIGMPILYRNPAEIGPDRVANAIAAWDRFHRDSIIIDFGTATTMTVVDGHGALLGGIILPGVFTFSSSLHRATALLPEVSIASPESAIGRSTIDCIRSGFHFGYSGMVRQCMAALTSELEVKPAVIATGGAATRMHTILDIASLWDPDLTLKGLLLAHQMNTEQREEIRIW